MKHLIIVAGIMGLLALAPAANADGGRWRGYSSYGDYGYVHPGRGYGHYRGHGPRRYDYRPRNYWRGGSYWNFSVGSGYRRHSHFDAGSLLGGVVLGTVLGQSLATSRYESRVAAPVYSPQRVTVIQRSPVSTVTSPPQRRLLRDLSGRCYEIFQDSSGTETRVELDPSACNF